MGAQEEDYQNTGTGVGADDGAYIAGGDILDIVFFPKHGFQSGSIFGAVAMADEYSFLIGAGFLQLLCQKKKLKGNIRSPDLSWRLPLF